ncbi:MAG: sigma-70 family RNA polymerase sigma factor [Chelatococcus sp.]|jgi:RNA polymerase sigma factor (sigma-70 family)|uniref:RNA polymerase sigma factor n=1 Tax=Chelatococcus sp. TaxID=1953771 RepID=UPI0025C52453|nr:sigma-70 family RNA polymerase sigma factor [Chelatococcus sp.]MBX3536670.1 sigma-70 family RNA polymerase sigma factor [Chelatococcus sp.]
MATTITTREVQDDLMSVYIRKWKVLRGLLKRHTGSHELAEDALQETWLRLVGMKSEPTAIQDRQAFILRVAGNIAIDLLRREKRHSSRCISDEALLKALADSYPSPETSAIDRDQLRFLALVLAQLPAKPCAALLMNRCDGLSHSEIAGRLGVSESMVARYLAQALRHCRDHFREVA